MFNSTSDENASVSDVHIGLDTSNSHDLEYIEEDYTNSTYEDLNNYTITKDYCLVSPTLKLKHDSSESNLFNIFLMGCSYESSFLLIFAFQSA